MTEGRNRRRRRPARLAWAIHPTVILTATTMVLIGAGWSELIGVGTRGAQAVLIAALVPLTLQAMASTRGMADRGLVQGLFAGGLSLLVCAVVVGDPWPPTFHLAVTVLGAAAIMAGQYRSRRI